VFNLVYESNTASTRIWDSLGFKRIGRVPGCGNLKSFDEPVDAIIYGRDLKAEGEDVASEERFDKIRYYLRHSLYPQGADRSEKSRLRSAATHYRLIPAQNGVSERLMLKKKEVISDPQTQFDIAKQAHLQAHGGINKTTAAISTKYHWIRIKETVSQVIKNCPKCKDTNKPLNLRADVVRRGAPRKKAPPDTEKRESSNEQDGLVDPFDRITQHVGSIEDELLRDEHMQDNAAHMDDYEDMAIDPQIMQQIQAQLVSEYQSDQNDYASFDAVADDHFITDDHAEGLISNNTQAGRMTRHLANRGFVHSNG
jgi:H2C2 zinc finger